jgi:hypothetical protein
MYGPWLSEAKDCNISICCFFTRDTTLKIKSKEGLDCNLDNVSECMKQHVYLSWVHGATCLPCLECMEQHVYLVLSAWSNMSTLSECMEQHVYLVLIAWSNMSTLSWVHGATCLPCLSAWNSMSTLSECME